jgi:hypothetical protein
MSSSALLPQLVVQNRYLRGCRRISKLRDGVAEVEWAVYVGCDHCAWVAL